MFFLICIKALLYIIRYQQHLNIFVTNIINKFYYICYKFIPIIHHEKKLSYTRLEPQLVEVLGWHQTMSTLQLIFRGRI